MFQLAAIPILKDNYVWVLHNHQSALLVDPGEAAPILAWLEAHSIHPVAGFVTHHHNDHCTGLAELSEKIPFYGPELASFPGRINPVNDGDTLLIPALNLSFKVIATPGHTLDHLCFYGAGHLFCGDTLFSCGCGKLFEGTPTHMLASLERLSALPDDTLVCPAHEYTLANLAFALDLEPDNSNLLTWHKAAVTLRRRGKPTLPVRLADERNRNPFLRCDNIDIHIVTNVISCNMKDRSIQAFTLMRALKNNFHV